MWRALQYLCWFILRALLAMRYRIRVKNKEVLKDSKGPFLVLPNHPAYVDPPIVVAALWPSTKPRPLVYEANYRNPVLLPLMKILNAMEVPDLEQASSSAKEQAERVVEGVIGGLKRDESFLIWPAGHLQHEGIERLGGARAASEILQSVEDVTVVLLRTRGLWGSMFSWAQTGRSPSLTSRLLAGVGYLLANLLFFMPRRPVEITVKAVHRNEIPDLERDKLNRWLEEWYNEDAGPEEPTWVPYHFLFGKRDYEYPDLLESEEVDLSKVKPKTKEAVREILSEKLNRELADEEYQPEVGLDELGLDSIDRMDVTLAVEHRFGTSGGHSPLTIGQLWALAEGLADKGPVKPPSPEWLRPVSDEGPADILEDTIPLAFVERVFRHPKDPAVADDLSGTLTYERMLIGALLMAKHFKKLEGKNVGLLLPASVGADVSLMALMLADKIPVVLNWTTGPGHLAHSAKSMGLSHVITSKAFVDRTGTVVEGAEYLFLEELRTKIGLWQKIATLFRVRFRQGSVRANLPEVKPSDTAVILFTSGSEKAPKAVPLTHDNLITDERVVLAFVEMTRKDILLGFLPPFHSFGLSVTGLLPILSGLRVIRHPDPTDASALVRKTEAYKPTTLAGTPTFVHHILDRARPEQLKSLRLIVVGAEKCPERVMQKCEEMAPQAKILEGYGITECSPVISANPPYAPRPGSIGVPLPGVEVRVVDLETGEPLGTGQQGMIQVSGPTVFPGYLNYDGPSPFVEENGKRWYVTGDLGEWDSDRYLWFRGRLKRFLKAGGEMISLPALEEPFSRMYPPGDEGPRVAVEGIETDHGRHIVLFCTEGINLREANAKLSEEGFRGVLRLDEVKKIDAIPTLGTGKTDYKVLRKQIEEEHAESAESAAGEKAAAVK